ncbi:hypothetical protein [Amycolatopsis sp. DG1A-15b]|uniref:hypothetical protein n=1 Tax=Amycolatopsis sp. DG1A-15b TaxID=3052846 RepID=UPI00255C015B|nr:hypothetical protein [Amycolatopsis sp. DG1A-15b]WIX85688.1 hypothetical protein QRY02_31295 [Amycolatopsis sp. DG1A-15b]
MSEQTPVFEGPVERAAHAAARRLASIGGQRLEADVVAALHSRDTRATPNQYFDPVSLGSLIVSMATLAWTVYKDMRAKTLKPKHDVVARRVRVELPPIEQIPSADQEQAIDIIVEEILNNSDG